jgi:sulfhydrogenase subunit beta (sulfur reductase)
MVEKKEERGMAAVKSGQVIIQAGKGEIYSGLDRAMKDYAVAAPKDDGEKTLFDFIGSTNEIKEEYSPTVLPPKKFFFPQEEVIFEYSTDGTIRPQAEARPMVLFGIRPCDAAGLAIEDEAFADSHGDPNYLARRNSAVVIAVDCKELCDEDSFCYKVNTHNTTRGFDIMLHDLGDDYALTVRTEKGKDFAEKYLKTKQLDEKALSAFQAEKEQAFGRYQPFAGLEHLPEVFEENKEHPVWAEEAKRCLSCGSCIMVCPTCYCFDVADELSLNMQDGQKLRRWDACMLSSFAVVAGGENFRESAEQRLKHRINRKFNYLMKKHDHPVCVGCGRCVRACLADISPKKIVQALTGEEEEVEA